MNKMHRQSHSARRKRRGWNGNTDRPTLPPLEDFVEARDFTGAMAVVDFQLKSDGGGDKGKLLLWLGYCALHAGDAYRAREAYTDLLKLGGGKEVHLYLAIALFAMHKPREAVEEAKKGPDGSLKWRLLFHLAHRLGDEEALMHAHQQLDSADKCNQLSLAAMHYLRGHFQEATDLYKGLLLEHRGDLALNVYVAMCYAKLDYYDVSNEILSVYLQSDADSVQALNLRACNAFRLTNGANALSELRSLANADPKLMQRDLIVHNTVVFGDGARALQKLPALVGRLPEAQLNLVIYHLRQASETAVVGCRTKGGSGGRRGGGRHAGSAASRDHIEEAWSLLEDLEPSSPQEYILKAILYAAMAQRTGIREHVRSAQAAFQVVGSSPSECDTIPGRQCMASSFFLLKNFDDVNIYLSSIMSYLYNDDAFNWNYGQSLAATGSFRAAEERLLLVKSEVYKTHPVYVNCLCRCYIMNGTPVNAWELYLRANLPESTATKTLLLIANDCYRMGFFYISVKAFHMLDRGSTDNGIYWDGLRGAIIGVFQLVCAGRASVAELSDVLPLLSERAESIPHVDFMIRAIHKHCADQGIEVV